MDERTTVEKRTTVVPDPAQPGSTNVNVDPNTGDTHVQVNEPGTVTVRETTTEKTTTRDR